MIKIPYANAFIIVSVHACEVNGHGFKFGMVVLFLCLFSCQL